MVTENWLHCGDIFTCEVCGETRCFCRIDKQEYFWDEYTKITDEYANEKGAKVLTMSVEDRACKKCREIQVNEIISSSKYL